ncbi:MAG TPA: hypothetical protein VMV41_00120 [Cellulomonadaceae bacterium]|nr:hypothetical protein [Cellulomonadaceae bacterium]
MAITVDSFLAALRKQESGNNYTSQSNSSTASGAYQYLDSTWNHYGGYARAWQAPPAVQDARARADVTSNLAAYGGDWSKVAAAHFAGGGWVQQHPDKTTWNQNPAPGSNNPTVASYVSGVLKAAGGSGSVPTAGGTFTTSLGTPATTASGSQAADPNTRPKDWIGTLDGLLNPTAHSSSIAGIIPVPDVGGAIQLVAARTGIALIGLVLFAGGLLLAVGPEVLGGAALAIPGAPEVAATVEGVKAVNNRRAAKRAATADDVRDPADDEKAAA